MPHVSDVRATSPDHDLHDRLLVAALAAGDLAATDRDHALALIRSCPACAELHDDLIAIAHATASVPPIAARPRDFQLTPADAARLRPSGLRGVLARLAGAPRGATRPLGAGLAMIGLVGLLVGNAPAFSFGSAASGGVPTSAGGASAENASVPSAAPAALGPVPAASSGGAASAAASSGSEYAANGEPSPTGVAPPADRTSGAPRTTPDQAVAGPVTSGTKAEGTPARDLLAGQAGPPGTGTPDSPLRPANVLFASALLVGLGLLVLSRRRGRASA
jgi:hypothetical protein